ncbi:MAG TPA: OsmC family protein [Gemmatimonadales bacterium]|jgi:uncharacterized OsmC-like protein|nr:OsmC family protein [Gemmatimonadales bacterium]
MTSAELRALQLPLKTRYREDPETARVTSTAEASLPAGAIQADVRAGGAVVEVGLHPATGGDGSKRCSADLLLEALVGCAGVTLQAVATAMGLTVRGGRIRAEGDWDARGTLGVSRDTPVGLTDVRLSFDIDSDATPEQSAKLMELVERYCVVAQTLKAGTRIRLLDGR